MDTKLMLEVAKRASKALPEPAPEGKPDQVVLALESQKQSIILSLTGITLARVALITKKRAPTAEEIQAIPEGQEVPKEVETVDVDAMLAPLRDNPTDPRWTELTEMRLMNEEDDLNVFEILSDPNDWRGLLMLMGAASGGGLGADPFAGKVLMTSVG
jgi:hypothetical protein